MAESIPFVIVDILQQKYSDTIASFSTYENEAGKEILEFSVKYPDPKPVGRIHKQARKAAITFNVAVLPDNLQTRVIEFFEKALQ